MPSFKYKGKNRIGTIVEGERIAKNVNELVLTLQKEQIQVLSVEKKRGALTLPFLKRKGRISIRALSVFNRQLSVMFNAGLPITQSLGILGAQEKNKGFQAILKEIRADIEAGSSLSNALRKHPQVFNDLYTSMIQAGEASGNLDTILLRLSNYIENTKKLIGKVKAALTYPIAVLIIAIGITAVILIKVVPVFSDMFDSLGAELPFATQVVVGISDFLQDNVMWVAIALAAIIVLFRYYYKSYKGRRVVDRILLRIWVFGPLLRKVAVARVTRTLSTLLNSGVEMIESITITARTAGNSIIEDAIMRSRLSVQEGKPLWESWEEAKVFPFMVTQMIGVGEQTGSLSTMLSKIADFYDEEVDQAVTALMALMEPVMIVLLGGLIGGVIIAMYLPLFDIIGKL